jgi:hypothetical protein
VVLPVVALTGVGFLARAFVDGGGGHWGLWLIVVAVAAGLWLYVFYTWPEWVRLLSALEDYEGAA